MQKVALLIWLVSMPAWGRTNPDAVVIYDFWASWCDACMKNLRTLGPVASEVSRHDIQFKAVSIDDNASDLKKAMNLPVFKDSPGLKKCVIRDRDGSLQRKFDINSVPVLIIATPEGKVLYRHEGVLTSEALNHIRKLATGKATPSAITVSKRRRDKGSRSRGGMINKAFILDATMDPGKTATASTAMMTLPTGQNERSVMMGGENGTAASCPTCGS